METAIALTDLAEQTAYYFLDKGLTGTEFRTAIDETIAQLSLPPAEAEEFWISVTDAISKRPKLSLQHIHRASF